MESKPSGIPRRISDSDNSSSLPVGPRRLYTGRESGLSDALYRREASKLDSELQESSVFRNPRRDYGFTERETREPSSKLSSSSVRSPGSYDRPWSGSFLESRSRLSSTSNPFQSSLYNESERPLGAHSRLYNQQQDSDSKRPKLSYSGSTSTSGVGSSSILTSLSDASWRGGQVPSSSPVVLSSASGTELRGRPLDRRINPLLNNFGDHSHRTYGLHTSSSPQDGVASLRAQGARPKDASCSSLNTSSSRSRPLPSEHYSSLLSRDSSKTSSRSSESVFSSGNSMPVEETELDSTRIRVRHAASSTVTSERTMPSPRCYSSLISRDSSRSSSRSSESPFLSGNSVSEETEQDLTRTTGRRAATSTVTSERTVPSPQRSFNEPLQDSDGRFTARQLLSRLASSMSSTFLRRSSNDSLYSRSLVTDSPYSVQRTGNSTQSSANSTVVPEDSDNRPPESSQSFGFLRRRRQGLVSPSHQNSESDVEVSRQYNSESRSTGSWLPSSFRNRCTPLFSRSRREGRDESARMAATSEGLDGSQYPLKRGEATSREEQENDSQRVRDSASVPPPVSSTAATSVSDSSQTRRNSGISGIPSSLFRFAMPSGLGSSLSDNVLITVDIMPSGRDQSERQQETHDSSQTSSSRDPERLKKIQESLLLEDSEEEEGDLCRICQMGDDSPANPLIEAPCKCSGSLQYVHQECMKKWLISKINSGSTFEAVNTCELCKEKLNLNLENFDIHELYRAHATERAEYEFISSGLYLVVLFHLCDQRFSNMLWAANEASTLRFFNLARTLGAQMDDLETSDEGEEDESEEEGDGLN